MDHSLYILVLGRGINGKKWNYLWELLDEAKEFGLTYDKYDIDSTPKHIAINSTIGCHGVIYLATKPLASDHPCIQIPVSMEENLVKTKIQEFVISLLPQDAFEEEVEEQEQKPLQKLNGVVTKIGDQEILLNEEDAKTLNIIINAMKDFNLKIIKVESCI